MTETAKQLRRAMTPAECRLWEVVRDRRCGEYRFYRQVPAGQYILDFYCASVRLAIEVDGPIHDLAAVQERDRNRDTALSEELRITLLRLTNAEVLTSDDEQLQKRILTAVLTATQNAPAWSERPARRR